jgi:hypothetical protein
MQKLRKKGTKEKCKYRIESVLTESLKTDEIKEVMCKKIARMIVNNGENRCTQV